MNEDFVSFDLAKKLKEKGFEWDCYTTFDGVGYTTHFCPTISQVLKWLREEKKIYCLPYYDAIGGTWFYSIINPDTDIDIPTYFSDSIFDGYETAALAGIKYCLDNLI